LLTEGFQVRVLAEEPILFDKTCSSAVNSSADEFRVRVLAEEPILPIEKRTISRVAQTLVRMSVTPPVRARRSPQTLLWEPPAWRSLRAITA
jgi:hypothetical protein